MKRSALLRRLVLLILRILQGAAIGGEVPGAWVFVSEHVPHIVRVMLVAPLTAGLTAGILLVHWVATALNSILTKPRS